MKQTELANHLEVDVQTVKRMEAGTREARRPELLGIATACSVPVEFFTHDLNRLAALPPSLEERLAAIEAAVGPLSQLERDLGETLDRLRPRTDGHNGGEELAPQTREGA